MSKRIYVVEDLHAIMYAGTSIEKAKAALTGSNTICVWEDDLWVGNMRHDGTWRFYADGIPTADPAEQPKPPSVKQSNLRRVRNRSTPRLRRVQ